MWNITFKVVHPAQNYPTISYFYACLASIDRITSKSKKKYKLCFAIISLLDICVYIVTTSKDYSSTWGICICIKKEELEEDFGYPSDVDWYINITNGNQVFEELPIDNVVSLLKSQDHLVVGKLNEWKFKFIEETIQKSNKAKRNLRSTTRTTLELLWVEGISYEQSQQDFFAKYGV